MLQDLATSSVLNTYISNYGSLTNLELSNALIQAAIAQALPALKTSQVPWRAG